MQIHGKYPRTRLRRVRSSDWMRRMVRETILTVDDLIWPIFVAEEASAGDIASMPGVQRFTIEGAVQAVKEAATLGIPAVAVFPCTPAEKKCDEGKEALNPDNLVCRAVKAIKAEVPNIGVITDVALDPYTDHGQDGLVKKGIVMNDETVEALAKQALNQARAGCDVIAPSDMMDGRVGVIRDRLDKAGFLDVAILSYAVKYASAFYGPFRDAVGSKQALGNADKRTYQMDPANVSAAWREAALDIAEGADMVMVKPGMPYLDIITRLNSELAVPVLAYQVSGEYAGMRFAAQHGAVNYEAVLMESLLSFKRAGASAILTYGAVDAAKLLQAA